MSRLRSLRDRIRAAFEAQRPSPAWLALWLIGSALVGVAGPLPERPLAEEATFVLMSESLHHDGDLVYEDRDLERARARWSAGPEGLRLASVDGGETLRFAEPAVFPLLGFPLFAAFGRGGLLVLNLLLFAATVAALRAGIGKLEGRGAWVWSVMAGSLTVGYVFLAQGELLTMACLTSAVALWLTAARRSGVGARPWLACGALFGLAASAGLAWTAVLGAVLIDRALARQGLTVIAIALGAVLAWGGVTTLGSALGGQGWPRGDVETRIFVDDYPIGEERAREFLHGGTRLGTALVSRPKLFAEAWYFLAGRQSGLVACYPMAIVALVIFVSGSAGRRRLLLAAAILGLSALAVLARAAAVPGEAGLLGNRSFAAIYPLLAFLPVRPPRLRLLIVPLLAAGLWALPMVGATALARRSGELARATERSVARWLPAELTRLADGERRGLRAHEVEDAIWVVPTSGFYPREDRRGIWARGDRESEVWLVTRRDPSRLALELRSVTDGGWARLESRREVALVHFDSMSKRVGTPVDLAVEASGADLATFFGRERYFRLRLRSDGGSLFDRPGRGRAETWYLGAYLDLASARAE